MHRKLKHHPNRMWSCSPDTEEGQIDLHLSIHQHKGTIDPTYIWYLPADPIFSFFFSIIIIREKETHIKAVILINLHVPDFWTFYSIFSHFLSTVIRTELCSIDLQTWAGKSESGCNSNSKTPKNCSINISITYKNGNRNTSERKERRNKYLLTSKKTQKKLKRRDQHGGDVNSHTWQPKQSFLILQLTQAQTTLEYYFLQKLRKNAGKKYTEIILTRNDRESRRSCSYYEKVVLRQETSRARGLRFASTISIGAARILHLNRSIQSGVRNFSCARLVSGSSWYFFNLIEESQY